MTKNDAIRAMREGKKVTHKYFSPDEWVTIDNGQILFEDGVRCSQAEFWAYRDNIWWDKDWELFNS